MILCVAANPSVDRLLEVERLAVGEIHRMVGEAHVAGGKGLNCARAAAALGAEVHAIALVGGFTGRWICEQLGESGVAVTPVWAQDDTRTCVSVADRSSGLLTEFYERGAQVGADVWHQFVTAVHQKVGGATVMSISGSLPPGAHAMGYIELMTGAGITAFDSTAAGIAARPSIVKLNAAECAAATNRAVVTFADALGAARQLWADAGGEGHVAIVTLGERGAIMILRDGTAMSGHVDAFGLYAVGSGDAFLAGLLVALDRGGDWRDAFGLALGAASANAEIPGAGVLLRDRAEALRDSAVVREV